MDASIIENNKRQIISESDSYTIRRYQSFLKYFYLNHKVILDFGCNTGRGGVALKSLRPDLVLIGADIIKERLTRIPLEIYDKIIDLSCASLSESIDNFDAIVSGEVVEHIPFIELTNYLKTFYNTLNSEGVLLITTPNPNSILVKIGRNGVFKDPSHINIMSSNFLKTLLQKIGFRNVIVKGSGKATKYLGENFPILNFYGSYLIIASK